MAEIRTHPAVHAKVQKDQCPKCGGELDTGWECNSCGFDAMPFIHISPHPDACEHDFQGWREFEDGRGGEQVCTKCGMGAMTYSLRTGF